MDLQLFTRKLKCEKDYQKVIPIIQTIICNILNNPNEPKYKTINCNNKHFCKIYEIKYAIDVLYAIGFYPKIIDMQEFLLFRDTPINKCILQDSLDILPKITSQIKDTITIHDIKKMQKAKQEYCDTLLKQAEEDRLEKVKREEIKNKKLKMFQDEKKKVIAQQMERLRVNRLQRMYCGK